MLGNFIRRIQPNREPRLQYTRTRPNLHRSRQQDPLTPKLHKHKRRREMRRPEKGRRGHKKREPAMGRQDGVRARWKEHFSIEQSVYFLNPHTFWPSWLQSTMCLFRDFFLSPVPSALSSNASSQPKRICSKHIFRFRARPSATPTRPHPTHWCCRRRLVMKNTNQCPLLAHAHTH